MKKIIINGTKKMFAIMFLFCLSSIALAQSGDKLFMAGQKLQQTMNISSQNAAIKKFQAAKVAYTTADKKKMCDNQISICNKNITSLRRGGSSKKASEPKETEATVPKLTLSHNNVIFEGDKAGSLNVKVEAATMDWSFNVPAGVSGTDNFLKVSRSNDAKSIDIAVEANNQTLNREQVINIEYGDNREIIKVLQLGKPVTLSTNYNLINFGLKGGKKTIEVYTNSDSIIADNYDKTWYVESKPDWVQVNVEVQKEKGLLGKVGSAFKKAVSGSASAAEKYDNKTTEVKLVVAAIDKKSPIYTSGRKGEIVFASQDKRSKLTIIQEK